MGPDKTQGDEVDNRPSPSQGDAGRLHFLHIWLARFLRELVTVQIVCGSPRAPSRLTLRGGLNGSRLNITDP
jgi:hypothetical protein